MFAEQIADFFTGYVGAIPYAIVSLAFFVTVPVLLAVGLVRVMASTSVSTRHGLLLGVAAAVWASGSWLAVPYLGAYPCLPALIAKGLLINWGPVETVADELTVHMANFVIWPLLGWSVVRGQRALMGLGRRSAGGNAAPPVAQA